MSKFGIEIEFKGLGSDGISIVESIQGRGFNVHYAGYSHETSADWKVVRDGSVDDGMEIVSPILDTDTDLNQVKLVLETLKSNSAYADTQCGIHIHCDTTFLYSYSNRKRDDFFRFLVACFQKHEPLFDELVKSHRVNPYYARSTIGMNVSQLRSNRYHKLNLDAYTRHGTVEYRQYHGTINSNAVIAWIKLVTTFHTNVRKRFEAMYDSQTNAPSQV